MAISSTVISVSRSKGIASSMRRVDKREVKFVPEIPLIALKNVFILSNGNDTEW